MAPTPERAEPEDDGKIDLRALVASAPAAPTAVEIAPSRPEPHVAAASAARQELAPASASAGSPAKSDRHDHKNNDHKNKKSSGKGGKAASSSTASSKAASSRAASHEDGARQPSRAAEPIAEPATKSGSGMWIGLGLAAAACVGIYIATSSPAQSDELVADDARGTSTIGAASHDRDRDDEAEEPTGGVAGARGGPEATTEVATAAAVAEPGTATEA
jgi:hypothetical protein